MRRINVTRLKAGMELAKPIYANNGVILLRDGTNLTQNYIEKIKQLDLAYIYIKDAISQDIEIDDLVSDKTKLETKRVLKESINMIKAGHFSVNEVIVKNVEVIITQVLANPRVMISLQEIRNSSEYLHMHSINVCIIALFIAKKKGYNDTQLKHLALGALLHDLGKTKIEDIDVTRYRENYNEQELITYREHVRFGYELIKAIPGSSLLAANVALTHHEMFDGTGFPLGKKNENIHEFSRIVAIANEYDNLVYNNSITEPMKHYEIIELIVSRAYTWFDPDIVRIFRSSVSPYPIGLGVRLSDGRIGVVAKLNENMPTRPIIRVVDPSDIQTILAEVDLSKDLSVMIDDEIDIDKPNDFC